jgi:hypothetical protein
VLVESRRATHAALPVLVRMLDARPDLLPAFPTLESIALPNSQVAATPGDLLSLGGHHLDGTNHRLVLSMPRLRLERSISPALSASAGKVDFNLPNLPANFPAGNWLAALQVLRPGETHDRTSNQVALSIAPTPTSLTSPPQQFPPDANGTATVAVDCTPVVYPTQRASLLLGTREVVADDHPVPTANLVFTVLDAPVGVHYVRLRIDGVDSALVNRGVTPPVYFDHRIEIG